MATVFISYAREDATKARKVYNLVTRNGHSAWLDERSLLPGQNWKSEIYSAIRSSDFFIACLSSKSVSKKGYVQKELKTACNVFDEYPDNEIFIIPIRFDACAIPQRFEELHCLDWSDADSEKMLLDSLNSRGRTASFLVEDFEIVQALIFLRSKTQFVFPDLCAAIQSGCVKTDGSKVLSSTLGAISPTLKFLQGKGVLKVSRASDCGDQLPLDPKSMEYVDMVFFDDIDTARLLPLIGVVEGQTYKA